MLSSLKFCLALFLKVLDDLKISLMDGYMLAEKVVSLKFFAIQI